MGKQLERRVYRAELATKLGLHVRTLRRRASKGQMPRPNIDPVSRHRWWPESIAREIVAGAVVPKRRAA